MPSHPVESKTSLVTVSWKAMLALFAPSVLACQPLKANHEATKPRPVPAPASKVASAHVAKNAESRLKPNARTVAISTARSDSELIMVFRAPAVAPMAMSNAIGQPKSLIKLATRPDCEAYRSASDMANKGVAVIVESVSCKR